MIKIGKYEFENMRKVAERLKLPVEETERLVTLYKNTENSKFDISIQKDSEGKLILPKGTLIHGVKYYGRLSNIAEEGLLARAVMSDLLGDYGVNGWKVEKEQSMKEFYDDYNTPGSKAKGRVGYIDAETGEYKVFHPKANFLPMEEKYCKGLDPNLGEETYIAFIIQPIEELNTIVNERLKLDHAENGKYKDASSIPIGIPKNAIAGILISKKLARMQRQIKQLIKNFPDQYITTSEGELIYEPNKEKKQELPISSDTKKSIENIAIKELFKNVQKISSEIMEGYKELENPVKATENKSVDE